MVLLTHEIRVALRQTLWIGLVQIRIELPNTWSVDAHIIAKAQTLSIVKPIAKTY